MLSFSLTEAGFKNKISILSNPDHPSLNLHPIRGTKGIWEGYVDQQYRFTFEIESDYYILRKVGSHDVIKKP